jgi:hypothetical protein
MENQSILRADAVTGAPSEALVAIDVRCFSPNGDARVCETRYSTSAVVRQMGNIYGESKRH